jgi:hypothetical protein
LSTASTRLPAIGAISTSHNACMIQPHRSAPVPQMSVRHAHPARLPSDEVDGCPENSEEARELAMIAEALETSECKRWPNGKVPAGRADEASAESPANLRLPDCC